jgi:hypothetical protein
MKQSEQFSAEITWGYVFTFGKHDGETIEEILEDDPSYIIWLSENTYHIINEEILRIAEENNFLLT